MCVRRSMRLLDLLKVPVLSVTQTSSAWTSGERRQCSAVAALALQTKASRLRLRRALCRPRRQGDPPVVAQERGEGGQSTITHIALARNTARRTQHTAQTTAETLVGFVCGDPCAPTKSTGKLDGLESELIIDISYV